MERWRKRQSNCERERERMRDSLPLPHRKINIGKKDHGDENEEACQDNEDGADDYDDIDDNKWCI